MLLEGTVEVVKEGGPGGVVVIATVEAPSVLGEMSLITDRPHSATVRARSNCDFRLLTRVQFDRLLQGESLAAYKVVATLADVIAWRLNRMDEKFVELTPGRVHAARRGARDVQAQALQRVELLGARMCGRLRPTLLRTIVAPRSDARAQSCRAVRREAAALWPRGRSRQRELVSCAVRRAV